MAAIAEELWYSYCCEITNTRGAGVLEGGVVSNSGPGDGGYELFVLKAGNEEIVGLQLVFIEDNAYE